MKRNMTRNKSPPPIAPISHRSAIRGAVGKAPARE
jgi:hypothetical protein